MPLWGRSNEEIQPDSESLHRGRYYFCMDCGSCVFGTETVDKWEVYSCWKNQVNSSLWSQGPSQVLEGYFLYMAYQWRKNLYPETPGSSKGHRWETIVFQCTHTCIPSKALTCNIIHTHLCIPHIDTFTHLPRNFESTPCWLPPPPGFSLGITSRKVADASPRVVYLLP